MIALSVNINKVATLRNARGGARPSIEWVVRAAIAAGAQGITVHPRADRRHITPDDAREVGRLVAQHAGVEYNIEGDPRPEWLDLVAECKPHQATLVPVRPGEITSDHGYQFDRDLEALRDPVERLKDAGVRVAAFAEAGVAGLSDAREIGIDRIELYTEPYARACERGEDEAEGAFRQLAASASEAVGLGLGVNAGHDLDLANLARIVGLPGLQEVSIGHALICDALEMGLEAAVKAYLKILAGEAT